MLHLNHAQTVLTLNSYNKTTLLSIIFPVRAACSWIHKS
jgi:hypothetical protein